MIEKDPRRRPAVHIRRLLPATPQEVFDAWTNPDDMREWMCPGSTSLVSVQLEVRIGGRFRIVMHDETGDIVHTGEYREIQPPERLVFTWRSQGTHNTDTLVTVELHPQGEETELVLTHELLPDTVAAGNHEHGWRSVVEKLARHLGRATK